MVLQLIEIPNIVDETNETPGNVKSRIRPPLNKRNTS